ncbi:hypothetical protein R6Q59_019435 [Mikania micrantha]
MYRHSPVRNQRSKGIKIKHVVQVCLLIAVCFWLIFQVKRTHDKKKEFDANKNHIGISSAAADEIVKLGRKDLQPKLEGNEDTREQEDEQEEIIHEEDQDNIEEAGDDENEQERSNMDDVDIIDEDRDTEEGENEDNDGQSETENRDEDVSTHEAREELYKADDASSAVMMTHDPENHIKNETLDDNSSALIDNGENESTTILQEKDSSKPTASLDGSPLNNTTTSTAYQFDSNATVTSNLTKDSEMLKSTDEENAYDQSKTENLETKSEDSSDPTHLEEIEVWNDLETLPRIDTEGEDTAAAE